MPAYVVARVNLTGAESMACHASAVPAASARYGGRYLFSASGAQLLEGDWPANGMAPIEVPSHEPARAWYDSPDHAPRRALRQAGGPTALMLNPDATPAG